MRRLFGNAIIMIVALLLLSNCAFLQNLIGQYEPQIYTFNYNGEDYSITLPQHIPLPGVKAQLNPKDYWNGVHALHVWYMEGSSAHPVMPVLSLWFAEDLGVFGLVWHTVKPDGTVEHEPFLVVKGLPIPTAVEKFNKFLSGVYRRILELKPENSI